MKLTEYLKQLKERLVKLFPEITSIEYQYKENADVHFLKILPSSVLESEEFAKFDGDITTEFYEMNISGMISFISDDSLIQLENVELLYNR